MTRALALPVDIGDDEPVTLAEACRVFFGGRLSPSALRTEAGKGNLEIIQIARKDFVTKRAIGEMVEKCRKPANLPASGSEKSEAAGQASSPAHGASKTANGQSAQDALRLRLKKLNASLPNTSPANTSRSAAVVPLRSQSPTS